MFIWSLLVILTLIGIQNMIIMPIFMVQTLPFSALREAFGLSSGHSWACSPLLFFNFSVAKIFREESVSSILGARIVEGIVITESKVVYAFVLSRQYSFVGHVVVKNRYAVVPPEFSPELPGEPRQYTIAESAVTMVFAVQFVLVQGSGVES